MRVVLDTNVVMSAIFFWWSAVRSVERMAQWRIWISRIGCGHGRIPGDCRAHESEVPFD